MRGNALGLGIGVGAIVVLLWAFRDHPALVARSNAIQQAIGSALSGPGTGGANPAAGASPTAATTGLRKCVAGTRTTYTDGACPPGSTAAEVEGRLSVVPATPAAPPAAAPPAADARTGGDADKAVERALRP